MGLFGRKKKEDELKAEIAEAKKEAEASKKAIKDLLDQNTETKQVKAEAERKVAEAEKKIEELESEVKRMTREEARENREDMVEARQTAMEERKAKLQSERKAEAMATHTVQEGETLSHIALKYYKHATPPYWQLLLEHNTEVLQGNERSVRAGMELEIPELPEELKD